MIGTTTKPLHILEVGLAWPPDTFLRAKLAGLAMRGIRVTVASYSQHESDFTLPGVEVVRMPRRDGPLWRAGLEAARELMVLARRRPKRLRALLVGPGRSALRPPAATPGQGPRRKPRDRILWLWLLIRLAPLEPDVVHFEWETAAVAYLPLVEMWRCPMVMSCWGGLERYAQSKTNRRWVSGVPAAFARAAAVNCVSEAMRAEAIRYGLEESKAHVIRAGVDTALFSPDTRPTQWADRV